MNILGPPANPNEVTVVNSVFNDNGNLVSGGAGVVSTESYPPTLQELFLF
jgi:hypothetical protein